MSNSGWKVAAYGIMALAPITLFAGGCMIGMAFESNIGLFLAGVSPLLRLGAGLIFTVHLLMKRPNMEGGTKAMWAAGLLVFFSFLVIPYYWYTQLYQPYKWRKIRSML